MENQLDGDAVQDMVRHWLTTPPNGYLGSDYGADLPRLLQTPQSAGVADGVITKLIHDVPILGAMPKGAINLYSAPVGNDGAKLFFEVAGGLIPAQ